MARVICCGCLLEAGGEQGEGGGGKGERAYVFEHLNLCAHPFKLDVVLAFQLREYGVGVLSPYLPQTPPQPLSFHTLPQPPPKTSSNSPRIWRRRPKPPIHGPTPTPTGPCARPAIITSARIPITRAGAGWRCAGWAVAVAGVVFEKGGAGVALVEGGGGESAGFGRGGLVLVRGYGGFVWGWGGGGYLCAMMWWERIWGVRAASLGGGVGGLLRSARREGSF
jgi:hypothetical protein